MGCMNFDPVLRLSPLGTSSVATVLVSWARTGNEQTQLGEQRRDRE